MPEPDERIEAALRALQEPERFRAAEQWVIQHAPELQHVLASVLRDGGYFDQAHETEVDRVVGQQDEDERRRAIRTLLAEETRIGMLIGVAVGMELAKELEA